MLRRNAIFSCTREPAWHQASQQRSLLPGIARTCPLQNSRTVLWSTYLQLGAWILFKKQDAMLKSHDYSNFLLYLRGTLFLTSYRPASWKAPRSWRRLKWRGTAPSILDFCLKRRCFLRTIGTPEFHFWARTSSSAKRTTEVRSTPAAPALMHRSCTTLRLKQTWCELPDNDIICKVRLGWLCTF